jgi:hypothetical protein
MRWRFSQALDGRRPHARSLGGRRHAFPEVEEPGGGDVVVELEHGREVAPEQLAHAVGEPIAIVTQVLQQTRDLAPFDDTRIEGPKATEAVRIGAQRISEDLGVAAVACPARTTVTGVGSLGGRWLPARGGRSPAGDRSHRGDTLDRVRGGNCWTLPQALGITIGANTSSACSRSDENCCVGRAASLKRYRSVNL